MAAMWIPGLCFTQEENIFTLDYMNVNLANQTKLTFIDEAGTKTRSQINILRSGTPCCLFRAGVILPLKYAETPVIKPINVTEGFK